MTRRRTLLAALSALGLAAAGVALAEIDGRHKAIAPEAFGMTEAAPGLYIDTPERAAEAQRLIAGAEAETRAFFGELRAVPRYLICTTAACAETFGLKSRGLTLGHHVILIASGGLDQAIVTHERVHAELHRFMGLADLIRPRFPAWFDEGLAAFLSGDTRLNRPKDPRQADWIRAARHFRDWGPLHDSHDWRDTYGAAARLVEEIEAKIGRAGLLALIHAVAGGEDFDTALAAALTP